MRRRHSPFAIDMKFKQKKTIRTIGGGFVLLGLVFAVVFLVPAEFNPNPAVWFTAEYYSQFLPVAVSVMLLICGVFLAIEHSKANFNLAVFGHTASEEAFFHWIGLTRSSLPPWVMWVFFLLSLVALWIAYANVLKQKRLSVAEAFFGISFGAFVVLLPRFL